MMSIAVVMGLLAVVIGWLGLIGSVRKKAMLALASRLGFQYMDRTLPASFPSTYEPFDTISVAWNVIQGQRKGTDIVVFDGNFGKGRGICRTFIAVQTTRDPFSKDASLLGNVLQAPGWSVFYGDQLALSFIPWSLRVREIEECVNGLML